jgi:hypothetical protein
MKLISNQATTVVGLTLDGGVLNAVEVKRSNGSLHVLKQVSAPLTLNPLHDEAELVGREIRNLLNAAQISTKRCVAGVPAVWALTVNTKLPDIEGEDVASFLEIEAERGFACNVDELQVSSHIYEAENGDKYGTLIGIPKGYLERFEAVLAAAQLKVVSVSIGLLALPDARTRAITAEIADTRINLLLGAPGGVAILRTIEGAFDNEGAESRVQGELLARELRITLAQLPSEVRDSVRQINVFGERRFADQLLADIQARVKNLHLRTNHVTSYTASHHGLAIPANVSVTSALSLAAEFLSDTKVQFEFLPPKPSVWDQISSKYSSRRLAYAGSVAAVLVLLIASGFLYQQYQLSSYRAKWDGMKSKVLELEEIQDKSRQFRPWHESSFGAMNIMRSVTEAFPEDGAVSAKMIEIRNGSVVSCSGTARDNPSLLKTIDRLRSQRQVRDLRVDQIRGKSPLQFTINFTWSAVIDED